MNDDDRERLVKFIESLEQDLPDVMEILQGGPYRSEIELARDAWGDIREKGLIGQCYEALWDPALGGRFDGVGLSGVHLHFKLGLIDRTRQWWKDAGRRVQKRIRTWLEAVDVVLGSFAKVVPPAEILLEFKEALQAIAGDEGERQPAGRKPGPSAPEPGATSTGHIVRPEPPEKTRFERGGPPGLSA